MIDENSHQTAEDRGAFSKLRKIIQENLHKIIIKKVIFKVA